MENRGNSDAHFSNKLLKEVSEVSEVNERTSCLDMMINSANSVPDCPELLGTMMQTNAHSKKPGFLALKLLNYVKPC